jgi:hypothetical protein
MKLGTVATNSIKGSGENQSTKNEMKWKIWKVINSNDIFNAKRCIKYKWIFKVKTNGIFNARLVAYG